MASKVLNALTVDVEDYFHASALKIPPQAWGSQEQRAERHTLELLEIFGESGTKATFFVLGWLGERCPSIVREIVTAGHEVACHGYSHQLIYNQTPSEFAAETRRAKRALEDISGQPVVGYRAASFSIVQRTTWALDILAEAGFEYDSSIFPVRHDLYGMPEAETRPHVLRLPHDRSLFELPPSVVCIGGIRIPFAGGGYFRLFPYGFTKWGIRRLNADAVPAIVYVHPWEIDGGQPRSKVGPFTRFRHYTNIGKVAARLRLLLADFSFAPMREIADACRQGNANEQFPMRGAMKDTATRSAGSPKRV